MKLKKRKKLAKIGKSLIGGAKRSKKYVDLAAKGSYSRMQKRASMKRKGDFIDLTGGKRPRRRMVKTKRGNYVEIF